MREENSLRTLIIADPHDRMKKMLRIVEKEPHDRLTILGDFFDNYDTGITDAAETAKVVKVLLNDPDTDCLLGNHDMSYGWGRLNREHLCPGYEDGKYSVIRARLMAEDWQKFKLHVWLEGTERPWLLSHAGVHPYLLHGVPRVELRRYIDVVCEDAWRKLNAGAHHFLLGRGRSRCGDQQVGGINWMDWDELVPIPGLNQMVGHSGHGQVHYKRWPTSENIDLDTSMRYYAVFEDGEMEIKSYDDLR